MFFAVLFSEEAPVEVLEETDNEAALQEEDSVLSLDLEKCNSYMFVWFVPFFFLAVHL